ncbi:uncharacterized protein LOC141618554 [Silene latifolia]|uniref:uncharacterized protein LOC141618554 n=1 Tax=Silene latifolia TaxID=37657 RepID=UPI003D777A17
MDPIKYLFEKPVLGRISRWTLMLAEFDLKYVPLKAVKGRAVADFLADNPIEEDSVTDMWSFPDENVLHVEDEVWDLYFDGASSGMGYGVGILLISPKGEHVPVPIKFDFLATNNAAEYEACLLGLHSAISLNIKRLLAKIEEMEKYFEEIHYVHLPREENQFADALSMLVALVNIPDHIDSMPLCVERRSAPSYINEINGTEEDEIEPWPQTNGVVEAANKTLTAILRKMSDNYKDWPLKIPFALWGYRTSIGTATGATPYYLDYGMEAVQPIELEVPSIRILLKSQVPEADWVQARYDSLVLLDERRLNALYQVQLYQKRIERAFNKKVKPRKIKEGDLVLKSIHALLPVDPRCKFKPNWAGPYLVKINLIGGAVRLTDLDGNDFSNPTNLDQLKKYYP